MSTHKNNNGTVPHHQTSLLASSQIRHVTEEKLPSLIDLFREVGENRLPATVVPPSSYSRMNGGASSGLPGFLLGRRPLPLEATIEAALLIAESSAELLDEEEESTSTMGNSADHRCFDRKEPKHLQQREGKE